MIPALLKQEETMGGLISTSIGDDNSTSTDPSDI